MSQIIWRPPPKTASCLETAHWALEVGLRPVLITAIDDKRSAAPGKQPIGLEWGKAEHDYQWFTASFRKHPKANLGLLLGPDGGIVDIEVEDRDQAGPVLERMFGGDIPETLGWDSTRGPHHLFLWDDRLARFAKSIIKGEPHYPGVEFRIGAGGKQLQSVCPPSMLPNAARRRWNSCPEIAPLPEAVLEDLERNFPLERRRKPTRGASNGTASHASGYVLAAIERECSAVATAVEGTRNDRLNVAAFNLGTFVGAGQLGQDDAVTALTAAADAAGLGELEASATIRSGIEAGKASPRDMSSVGRTSRNGNGHHDGNGPASTNGQPKQVAPKPEAARPRIVITTEEHAVNDQAVAALGNDPAIYQRGFALVNVRRDSAPARGFERPLGSPRIAPLPIASLRERLTAQVEWVKLRRDRNGDEFTVPSHPPDWSVAAIAARGEWSGIRHLTAVVEAPVLRHDGSILDVPGYDERTGLLYVPNAEFPAIPAKPTAEHARKAAEDLLEVVADFPFAELEDKPDGGKAHRAAWLAGLLTPLARFAIDGPCPMFMIDANVPGSGKSLLTDIIALASTGRTMPRTAYPDGDEEMRKRITSVALACDQLMLIDNIASTFGGSSLDSALTATTWRDRYLGRLEATPELPLSTVWYGTGNNVAYRGDVLRRIVPCRLESPIERPEERDDFAIRDLLGHVRSQRPRLVAAALTVLRAHAVAGHPSGGLTPLGSFESWSAVVRSAIHWCLGVDPCATRKGMAANDPEALNRAALIEGWAELPNARNGVTVAEALRELKANPALYSTLRGVLMEWSRTDELPGPRVIGNRLKAVRGRVCNEKSFQSVVNREGVQMWKLTIQDAGSECSAGSSPLPRTKKSSDSSNTNIGGDGCNESPQSIQTQQDDEEEVRV